MSRFPTRAALLPVLGVLGGLAVAAVLRLEPRRDHSCPSAAPPSACSYPLAPAHYALFGVAGLLLGLAAVVLTWALARRVRPAQDHPDMPSAASPT